MFCPKCGTELDDDARYCRECGAPVQGPAAEGASGDGAPDAQRPVASIYNTTTLPPLHANSRPLREDRSLAVYILLSICTCGLYGYWFIHSVAEDLNAACEGDGENTPGLGVYLLLSFFTCGLYNLYWIYRVGNRMSRNAPRYNLMFQENGTTFIVWYLVGCLLCFIGSYFAVYLLIRNMNTMARAYNVMVLGREL